MILDIIIAMALKNPEAALTALKAFVDLLTVDTFTALVASFAPPKKS